MNNFENIKVLMDSYLSKMVTDLDKCCSTLERLVETVEAKNLNGRADKTIKELNDLSDFLGQTRDNFRTTLNQRS